ncbi:MAG: GH25 family lysozyme [Candidatus Cryptobacteroides sp.]
MPAEKNNISPRKQSAPTVKKAATPAKGASPRTGKAASGATSRSHAPRKTTAATKKNPARHRKKPLKKKPVRKFSLGWKSIAAICSGVLALVLTPMLLKKNGETGARVPKGIFGKYAIDISHHNGGKIVWDSLFVMTDASGRTTLSKDRAADIHRVSFAFIKATEGEEMVDRMFSENWKNAGESPVRRGAYHFFRSSKSAKAQADNFIRTVGTLRHGDLPPVLDIETMHRGCTKEALSASALEWLRKVEEHYGRKPVVYTSDHFASEILSREITEGYPLWIAHYDTPAPLTEDWAIWQFTDRAVIVGLHGKADLSICRSFP